MRDRLGALPSIRDKKSVGVCVRPGLSDVTEITEWERSGNFNPASTLKLNASGYCHTKRYINNNRNSQSDSDIAKNFDTIREEAINQSQTPKCSQSDKLYKRDKSNDDRAFSHLLVTTIGSTDESVINATLEKIPKNKNVNTNNLIESLIHEALQAKGNKADAPDSGINTGDVNKQDLREYCEAIESTPFADVDNILQRKQKERTVVSKSTSDESNTEAINDTPMTYVNVRRRNLNKKVINENVAIKSPTYDVQAVEDFFSQHFTEDKTGDLIISPTLAKKINVTSSETSEDFDQCFVSNDKMNNKISQDVKECLNSIIKECPEYCEREDENCKILNLEDIRENENYVPLHDISNSEQCKQVNEQNATKKSRGQGKRKMKLRYSMKKSKPKSKKASKNKLPLQPVSKMSTIIEVNADTDVSVMKNNTDNKTNDFSDNKNSVDNSVVRRKRKLYSPKDESIMYVENKKSGRQEIQKDDVRKSNVDDAVGAKKNNTSAAMCYRELEKERQNYRRTTKRRSQCNIEAVSPKTKKLNDVFDNLKQIVESEERIMLVDKKSAKDLTIFNYTSESEDEDFKQKKIELQKRTSTTTVGSRNSVFSTRRGRAVNKINYTENGREPSIDTNKKPNTKRKICTKRNTRSKKTIKEVLIDEKVRDAVPETLETSFVVEKEVKNKEDENLVPHINAPEFEILPEDNLVGPKEVIKTEKSTAIKKSKVIKQIKKSKKALVKKEKVGDDATEEVQLIRDKEDERTISPLPGLLVETVKDKPNLEDSLPSYSMVKKLKKVYQEGGLLVVDAFNETNGTNTIQNLLSDNDRMSPQLNITEEFKKNHEETAKGDNTAKYTEISHDITEIETLLLPSIEDRRKIGDNGSSKKIKHSLRLKSRIPSVIESSVEEPYVEKSDPKIKLTINSLEDNLNSDKNIWSKMETQNKKDKKQIETIHINDRSALLKSKTKDHKQEIETLIISDISEKNSEKSIATVGITAHGHFDEPPPSSDSLKIRHLPREIVDMDASTKEYYIKLQRQVNLGNTNSSKSEDNIDARKNNCDEISVKTSPSQKKTNIQRQKSRKWTQAQINSSSSDGKNVSVSIPRMSRNEILKWLPSSRNSSTDHEDSVQKSSSDVIDPMNLHKWLPSPRSSDTELSKKSSTKLPFKRSTTILQREIASSQNTKRKSAISPIRFFDELTTNIKYNTRNSTKNDTLTSSNANDTSRKQDSENENVTRSIFKETLESACKIKESTSIKRTGGTLKYFEKEAKEIPIVDVSSGPSVSSVDDWFERNTTAVKRGN